MKKVFNRILAYAFSLGVISGNINTIPGIVKAEEFVNNGFAIANEIGLDTNSVEVAEDIEKLSILNDNALDITVSENNEVSQINGLLSDISVNYGSDALAVIDGISDLLGIDSTYRELKLEKCTNSLYNDIYTFKQYYNGLEMVNSYITVIVDKETREPEFLNSSYNSDFSLDTTPTVSENQALDIVKEIYGDYSGKEPRLVIYTDNDNVSSLAWECNADTLTTGRIYVDAVNGNIIFEENLVNSANEDELRYYVGYNPLMPKVGPYSVKLDHNEIENNLYFRNKNNNYAILKNNNYSFDNDNNLYIDENGAKIDIFNTSFRNNVFYTPIVINDMATLLAKFKAETAVLYNIEKAYDFYNNNFNWKCADGNGTTINVIPAVEGLNNACAYNGGNLLVFGGSGYNTTIWGADPDIVVHEFTHLITHEKLGWGGYNSHTLETNALNEAYSDIMAEYADETQEWLHGNDLFYDNGCIRNHIEKQYKQLFDYSELNKNVDCHDAATIITHAAYLMDKAGIPDEVAMRMWYTSLDYLPKDPCFKDCRDSVIKAITKVVNDTTLVNKYTEAVEYAFDSVGIYGNKN